MNLCCNLSIIQLRIICQPQDTNLFETNLFINSYDVCYVYLSPLFFLSFCHFSESCHLLFFYNLL